MIAPLHRHIISNPSQLSINIFSTLDKVQDRLRRRGISMRGYTPQSVMTFRSLPISRQVSIAKSLETYLSILEHIDKESPDSTTLTVLEEKQFAEYAVEQFNLRFNTDFLTKVDDGDVIEIYDTNGIQLYRNFQFFKLCTYSLLDLLSNEWFVLYERAQAMTDGVFSMVGATLAAGDATKRYKLPKHTHRERYLDANRIFEMEMKVIAPLKVRIGDTTGGFIHSLTATPVLEGNDSSKIAFI